RQRPVLDRRHPPGGPAVRRGAACRRGRHAHARADHPVGGEAMSAEASESPAEKAARELIERNRRRLRIRRWIGWCALPFVLVAMLFSGKVLSMYGFAYQTIASYVVGDHAGAIRAAEGLQPVNIFEPYK